MLMGILEKSVYTIRETCKELGICRTTLWKEINAKRIVAYRIGCVGVRITAQAIEDYRQLRRIKGS